VTVLSRMARLAIAAEPTPGTYQPPAFTVTFGKGTTYRQRITPLRDRALRASDSTEQDLQQGPAWSEWTIGSDGYPDLAGWYLRALIGPDTFTPGAVTTLTAAASPGFLVVKTVAAPAAGSVVMIGAGATTEYVQLGTPSGSGPFTCPAATPLRFAHAAGEPVQGQGTHVFTQGMEGPTFGWPRYSLTMDDGTGPLGWPGCVFGSLTVTISKDGIAGLKATASGFPPAAQDTFAYDATPAQPMQGWEWAITTGGGPSARGLELEFQLHRKLGIFPVVAGMQRPLGIWPGPLQADAAYSAIHETGDELDLFSGYLQDPAVHTLTQPVLAGGCSLALTMPRAGYYEGEPDQRDTYLAARYKISGLAQPIGGAAFTATLLNYWPAAY
jgi:hypothetical protein